MTLSEWGLYGWPLFGAWTFISLHRADPVDDPLLDIGGQGFCMEIPSSEDEPSSPCAVLIRQMIHSDHSSASESFVHGLMGGYKSQ